MQSWMFELDNTGTNHKNLEKAKNKETLALLQKDTETPPEVYQAAQLVFRFFQLLCENHNHDLQV